MDEIQQLIQGAAALNSGLTQAQAGQLLRLMEELTRWNRSFNLTSITRREAMLTHHLLDSLAVDPYLKALSAPGQTVADVGTGAGFPGLPLALVNPGLRFTLIDSAGKKIRFVSHAAHAMGLKNVEAVNARAEQLRPPAPFTFIVARALAALPQLVSQVQGLTGPGSRVLAMKGRRPDEELAGLPPSWEVEGLHVLTVPGLAAERTLVILRPLS